MFKSIIFGHNSECISIIDDDFEEKVSLIAVKNDGGTTALTEAIVRTYSSKKLNVPANLVKYIQWSANRYLIDFRREFYHHMLVANNLLLPYNEELEKYILLL